MSEIRDFKVAVQMGKINGFRVFKALGERETISTTVTGEDVTRLNELSGVPALPASTTTLPTPADAGEQMTFISEDDADNGAAATGILTLDMHYLNADGVEQEEIITMNGQTEVDSDATDIRFINEIHALTVGANGVAEGNIRVYKKGSNTLVYNMIEAGGNMSLVPHRMVPKGHALFLQGWHATEAKDQRCAFRIRATARDGILTPGTFNFMDVAYLKAAASGELSLTDIIPALSIVKVTGWNVIASAEGSTGWWGYLVEEALVPAALGLIYE